MKKLFSIILLVSAFQAMGQKTESVTLTVSGSGATKQDAQTAALRSAIEQAFGAFISSKTEIIDDKLTKDEIVSITNGSVEKFNVISELQLPDQTYAVTLTAKVSVTKLTNLLDSKGITVEINGAAIAANIKLQKLNEEAEYKAIINLCTISWQLLSKAIDFELEVGKPKQYQNIKDEYVLPMIVHYKYNNNYDLFSAYFLKTLKGISMSKDEFDSYSSLDKSVENFQNENGELYRLRNPKSALALKNLFVKSNIHLLGFTIVSKIDSLGINLFNSKEVNSKYYLQNGYSDKMDVWVGNTQTSNPIIFAYSLDNGGSCYSGLFDIMWNRNNYGRPVLNKIINTERFVTGSSIFIDFGFKRWFDGANRMNTIIALKNKPVGKFMLNHRLNINQLENLSGYTIKPTVIEF